MKPQRGLCFKLLEAWICTEIQTGICSLLVHAICNVLYVLLLLSMWQFSDNWKTPANLQIKFQWSMNYNRSCLPRTSLASSTTSLCEMTHSSGMYYYSGWNLGTAKLSWLGDKGFYFYFFFFHFFLNPHWVVLVIECIWQSLFSLIK